MLGSVRVRVHTYNKQQTCTYACMYAKGVHAVSDIVTHGITAGHIVCCAMYVVKCSTIYIYSKANHAYSKINYMQIL